ncbi:MAG: aminopeptidase [Bacteroidetes bacterium]|nr:aminopeptidase [Bacteroidota bacterium]
MKKFFLFFAAIVNTAIVFAQTNVGIADAKPTFIPTAEFTVIKNNDATPVKNQSMTGTCWAFSTTSLVESQLLKNHIGNFDLSEMFTVRNIYIEKAKNYVLRQGHAQFGEGGLGHDLVRAIELYGAMPDDAYSGLTGGQKTLDHTKLAKELKDYLDEILKTTDKPLSDTWLDGYNRILDQYMGVVPADFTYNGKKYTAKQFAKDVMKFDAGDYVNITSFTHEPYYKPFIVQVPDNFSNGYYYNLPLNEMIEVAKSAVNSGYTLMWDADVSNNGFRTKKGLGLYFDADAKISNDTLTADVTEAKWDPAIRQQLYEELVTQDDHLMHITGIEKSKGGKTFFIVKNSWGNVGPCNGYMNISESYFAINTVTLVVPKAAISNELMSKLKGK